MEEQFYYKNIADVKILIYKYLTNKYRQNIIIYNMEWNLP